MNAEQTTAIANTASAHSGLDEADDEINLGEILATLLEYKWLIAVVTFFALLLGVTWLFVATPIYQANALLQVEDKKSAGLTALEDLQPLMGESVSISAQLEILNSRMILGRVVDQLKLEIQAAPHYLPVFGRAIARRQAEDVLASPLFGLSKYAWGGEKIRVETLDVPKELLDENLTLIAGKNGAYQVFDEDDAPLLSGQVGQPATAKGITMFVSQLVARPGTEFRLTKLTEQETIENLRENYQVKERAKSSGILEDLARSLT